MAYKSPKERMQISLRRDQVDATGLPIFTSFEAVPEGLVTKSGAKHIGKQVEENEPVAAYVFSRSWNGYLPLYDRKNEK